MTLIWSPRPGCAEVMPCCRANSWAKGTTPNAHPQITSSQAMPARYPTRYTASIGTTASPLSIGDATDPWKMMTRVAANNSAVSCRLAATTTERPRWTHSSTQALTKTALITKTPPNWPHANKLAARMVPPMMTRQLTVAKTRARRKSSSAGRVEAGTNHSMTRSITANSDSRR